MRKRITLYLKYITFWLLFFIIIKIVFLLYHFSLSAEIGIIDCFRVLWHGIKLDISSTAYLMILPTLFILIFPNSSLRKYILFFKYYTIFLLFLFILLCIIDLELYTHWGFRLDSTPLMYINTPGEMMTSTEWYVVVRQVIIGVLLFISFWYIFRKFISAGWRHFSSADWRTSVLFLFILGSLIIPLRGGFGIAPINTGSAYFHKNLFANHAANNLVWNLGYSLANIKSSGPDWKFMDKEIAETEFDMLMQNSTVSEKLINERPNIIIVILESFTAKIIQPLGGMKNITPNLNSLAKEGILFTKLFASGDRSDKGLLSILSGYPSQPNVSIIKFPQKTQSIPGLNKDLKSVGYESSFYYGGDINFANFRSYFVNMGYDKIISMNDFDDSVYNSKWGVHDHILLERFSHDLNIASQPFFSVVFTLSSHEPFDVPMQKVIDGNSQESKFLNSAFYTDKCIGEFVKRCKSQSWWDNSLLIFISDHGNRHPGSSGVHEEEKYRIPMLWIGGAIKQKDITIDTFCSQSDMAKTLLNQLGISNNDYVFSKDILADSNNSFGFYTFNSGFGFFSDHTKIVYDLVSNYSIIEEGIQSEKNLTSAKAYLQILSRDFSLR